MKVISISEIATFKISNDDRIKLMILKEKWKEAIRNTNNKVIITDGKTPVILQ